MTPRHSEPGGDKGGRILSSIAWRKDHKSNDNRFTSIQYEMNPDLTALDLLEKADLTDKRSIYEAAFMPVREEMHEISPEGLEVADDNTSPRATGQSFTKEHVDGHSGMSDSAKHKQVRNFNRKFTHRIHSYSLWKYGRLICYFSYVRY